MDPKLLGTGTQQGARLGCFPSPSTHQPHLPLLCIAEVGANGLPQRIHQPLRSILVGCKDPANKLAVGCDRRRHGECTGTSGECRQDGRSAQQACIPFGTAPAALAGRCKESQAPSAAAASSSCRRGKAGLQRLLLQLGALLSLGLLLHGCAAAMGASRLGCELPSVVQLLANWRADSVVIVLLLRWIDAVRECSQAGDGPVPPPNPRS